MQIVYCCWLAFEFVFLYFMIVETKNRTLEETAALFDGEDISKHVVANVDADEVRNDHKDYDMKLSEGSGQEILSGEKA